jgi:hypothetical protein
MCLEDVCEVENHFTCIDGVDYYCERGQCYRKDCNEYVCSKVFPPTWLAEEAMVTITREGGWSQDLWDYVTEPNDGFAEPLFMTVRLNAAGSSFLSESDGNVSQNQLTIEEYASAQSMVASSDISITVIDSFGGQTEGTISFTFEAEIIEEEVEEEAESTGGGSVIKEPEVVEEVEEEIVEVDLGDDFEFAGVDIDAIDDEDDYY